MRRVPMFAAIVLLTFSAGRVAAAAPDSPESNGARSNASADPSPAPAPAKGSSEGRFPVGIGVKVSSLGIGGEAAVAVSHRSNIRVGFNAFSYGHTFDKDGVTY